MIYLLLIVVFVFLIKGADLFVDGSSNISRLLRVSPIVIGLTIVAFGTSAPEATVSIIAAIDNSADVSLGNVIGSNILNMTFIVGAAAYLYPLHVKNNTIRKEIPFTLLSSILLLILISDQLLQKLDSNLLTRSDGLVLLIFLSIFMYYIFELALKNRTEATTEDVPDDIKWWKSILFTLLGLAGIIIGGQMVVSNGKEIALQLGMSETLVGLTIIAIGTSLPELVTSVTAALKKESDIALGNIVGSNIFNILFVLGASAFITPLPVNNKVFVDIWIMLALTCLLFIFSRTNYRIGKIEGLCLMIAYVLYLTFIIIRN